MAETATAWPIVHVRQHGVDRPPVEAELREEPADRPHLVKVVYTHSRTGAWVARNRIVQPEHSSTSEITTMPPRKRGTTKPSTPVVPAALVSLELLEVDPATLVVGANVRLDPRVDADLVESVRESGVLQPVIVYRDGDQLVVLSGQRRTLAAVQAGRPTIPVVVTRAPTDDRRLVDQLAENVHRAGLTVAETAAAYEQLAAFGLTAAQIARRVARPRAEVEAGLAVAASDRAREVAATHPLTLDQVAVVAEFDGDGQAVEQLTAAAQRGHGFDHVAQDLRHQRDCNEAMAALAARLTADGVTVIDKPSWDAAPKRLVQLAGFGDPEAHADCPGHAAFVDVDWIYDDETEDDSDDDTQQPPRIEAVVEWVCLDPAAHGHTMRSGRQPNPAPGQQPTEAERESASAERRRVIANNRAWDNAQEVRRAWLKLFAARRTAPKSAAAFVAGSLACGHYALGASMALGNPLAHDLLGLGASPAGYHAQGAKVQAALDKASDGRAQVIGLVLVLAAYEESATDRTRWRTVDPATARYLRYLEAQGYELSDVERLACGDVPCED